MEVGLRFAAAATGFTLLIASGLASAAFAAPPPCVTVTVTGDGDTLELSLPIKDTTLVRLASVVAPLPPANAPADKPWPPTLATRSGLSALILGRCLSILPDAPPVDRYNRLYAQVYGDDGMWVQGELVRRGLVIVLPGLDSPERIRQLLRLEAEARANHRGLWASDTYAVRPVDEAGRYVGTLQLVEGEVHKATRVSSSIYLNFDEDWRTDFTIVIPANSLKAWKQAGVDPLQLAGKRVRVRGIIETSNGPMIEALQPEMIEVLGDKEG